MNTPFIVAEMSANHNGSLERALATIDAAADAGCDGFKIQTWTPESMVAGDHVINGGPWAGEKMVELYRKAHLPWEWHQAIFDHCKARGIVGFSSPFDLEAVKFLQSLDCPIYKIGDLYTLLPIDL